MTRVFVIASTPASAEYVTKVLAAAPDIFIERMALHGEDVLRQLNGVEAEIVAVDGDIPLEELQAVTRSIMNSHPLPLVVFGLREAIDEIRASVEALDIGALSVLSFPQSRDDVDFAMQTG